MKLFSLPHDKFSASSFIFSELPTAHSGLELLSTVPNQRLAVQVAQELLTDNFSVVGNHAPTMFGLSTSSGGSFSLSRK